MQWVYFILTINFIQQIYSHVAIDYKVARSLKSHNKIKNIFVSEKENFTPAPTHLGPYVGNCVGGALCVQFVSCPAHIRIKTKKYCETIGGSKGICCTTGQNHTEPFTSKDRGHQIIKLDFATLGAVSRKTRNEMSDLRSREAKLLSAEEATILYPGSASYSHFRNSRRFNLADLTEVANVASRALEIAIATRAFKDRQGISNLQLELGMVQQDLRKTPLGHNCLERPHCPTVAEKYRRIDGSCNNRHNPSWGTPLSPFSRLLPPSYQDGIWLPRVSELNGQELPSPRLISSALFTDEDIENKDFTLMVMQFGQFLSHDLTQSLDTTYDNGSAISCCTQDGNNAFPIQKRHYACMPIGIPEDDTFFGVFQQRCMNFVRSVLTPRYDCTLGYSQQMNKITHFIDGSSIYGSTPKQTGELRSFEGGKLKVFNDYGRELLPITKESDACLTMEQGSACFSSGDTRTNQMITLVVLHTIFMREHNRVAGILADLNPEWEDQQIFLEARQIVVAEMQVIIYKEFLPAVIGELAMEEFDLNLRRGYEFSYDYDEEIDPSIINEFATAAFRFGHSTVNGLLKLYGRKKTEEMIFIPEVMFYPARMRMRNFLDEVLSTLTTEPIQEVDGSFSDALTNYLFRAGNPFGVDLAALNIQRGRDHGLRPYNDYRQLTGLPRYTSFNQFGSEIGKKLGSVYATVDDVDLWVGGLLEEKAPGSIVGPTFRDIIAEQFSRLKKGDKYFFENAPSINPGYFTPVDNLSDISNASTELIDDSIADPDFSPSSNISSPRTDYCCLLSDDEEYFLKNSDASEEIPFVSPIPFNECEGEKYDDDINKDITTQNNSKGIRIINNILINNENCVNLKEKYIINDQFNGVESHDQLDESNVSSNKENNIMYEYRLISNEKVESQDRLHENTELSNKENQNFYQNPPACNSSGSGDLQEKSIAYNEPSEYCLADFGRLPFTVTEFLSAKVAKARRDKRIWDKRDFCLYCYENVTNFSRHLLRKHNSEVAVKQFMNMRLGSIERKNFIDLLRKKGNFISPAQKQITMVKRPTRNVVPENIVPCIYCKGYYMKRYLKRHISKCKNRPDNAPSSENCSSQDAQTYLAFRCMEDDFANKLNMKKGILNMRCDSISLIVKSEPLILSFGSFYVKRHRHKHLNKVTKNKLRELARLWQDITRYIKDKSFFEALKPENFKYFVLSTQNITGFNVETQQFEKSPSLALHLGTTLKKLCDHAFSEIQQKNKVFLQGVDVIKKAKEVKTLRKLIETNWNAEVSSVANQNLMENQWKKPTIIPLTSDIQKLNNFVKEIAKRSHENLLENMNNRKAFNDLQKCCYTLLITLNRRRVGELERLELESYLQENIDIISQEFQKNLTDAEKILLKKYKRISIRGKRHKPVPVLISEEIQKYISTLLSARKKFAPDRNPYLFVTVNKETCLDGYSALRNFANASGAEYPQALTSGKLRKHIATISQIHNLDSCELEQLCSFLGHTMTTHQNFYRLPQELYQTAKLAKHLLKSQNETADIDNNLMDQVLSSDDDDENIVNDVENIQSKNIDREKSNSPVSVTVQPKKINLSRVSQGCLNNEQELNEENTDQMTRASNLKNSGRVKHAKVKWTAEQKRITKDYFKNDINEKKPPTKSEIEVFKELYPIMENKTWQKIKVFVYNIYKSK